MSQMKDGFSTIIAMPQSGIQFSEVTIKPPGFDMGGKIDITSMRNDTMRTYATKSLMTVTDITCTVKWDPAYYDTLMHAANGMGVERLIVITFPDLSTISFYGFIDKFEPQEHREGELPLANLTISCTNLVDDVETLPNYVAP